jgi:C4-dicarboxylate-specific signal transduction histidine kinase
MGSEAAHKKSLQYLGQRAILGELAWGIFHELNNHLQIVLGFTQDLCDTPMSYEDQSKDMSLVLDEVKKCCQLLKNIKFLQMANDSQGYEDIEVALDNILPLLHYKLYKKSLQCHKEIALGIDLVQGETSKIRSAMVVLLAAAVERSLDKSDLYISGSHWRDRVVLEVKFSPAHDSLFSWSMEEYLNLLDYSFDSRGEGSFLVYSLKFPCFHAIE